MSAPSNNTTPIQILTGFLGSGKTRFLSELLLLPEFASSAVIINEFGKVGLDHLLVEHTNDQLFALPNGCICCNARGQIIDKILDLKSQQSSGEIQLDRIIIETSGISDAANLMENLSQNSDIRQHFRVSKIITMISALEWKINQSGFDEAQNQIMVCDEIIISKLDLLDQLTRDQELAHLTSAIELLNPVANIHILPMSEQQKISAVLGDSDTVKNPIQPIATSGHASNYQILSITHPTPISQNTFELFIELLLNRYSTEILRVKGLGLTLENPNQPLIIQAVNTTLSPFSHLDKWTTPPHTQLTIIHRGSSNIEIQDLFNSTLDIPSIDQPDKAALSDNPLSIPGMGQYKP